MRAALLLTVSLTAVVSARPAVAFELFGIHLWGERKAAEDDVIGDPVTYTVDASVGGDDRAVESAVRGASQLVQDAGKPASGSAGLIAKARGDYRRILAALYTQGHYGGTISIRVNGAEASDLAPDAALPPVDVPIAVTVDPGPKFLFSRASVVNAAPPATRREDAVADLASTGFIEGEVARSTAVSAAGKLAVEAWRQQGYPKAAIASRDIVADHPTSGLEAILTAEPGPYAVLGLIDVSGAERMDPDFVAWYTGLQPGAEYDPDDIALAEKRLQRLDVFQSARVDETAAVSNGQLPLTVTVDERKLRRFGIGASFSTIDGLGAETYWLHRNLFGRAERLRFDARVSGVGDTIDPREFDYTLGASFKKPGVFTPDTDFLASIVAQRITPETYTETSVEAQAGFSQIVTENFGWRLFANVKRSRFEDDLGTRDFLTAGFLGGVTLDTRDDPADATEGYYVDITAEPFHEFEFGNTVLKGVVEGRAYLGFGNEDRPTVLAGRLKLGTLGGASIAELPPDKLFFAGGGGSVRGYAFRNIGIRDAMGNVTGGRSLIEGSAEVRARITDSIGVVGFADFGYVGEDTVPGFSEHWQVGVGAGLRYFTGLGPIRVDVAVPLNPRDGDPAVGFYAGIGQAF